MKWHVPPFKWIKHRFWENFQLSNLDSSHEPCHICVFMTTTTSTFWNVPFIPYVMANDCELKKKPIHTQRWHHFNYKLPLAKVWLTSLITTYDTDNRNSRIWYGPSIRMPNKLFALASKASLKIRDRLIALTIGISAFVIFTLL